MNKNSKITSGFVAIGFLAACGGGETANMTAATPPSSTNLPVASSATDVTGKVLADGTTLEGLAVAGITLNYDTDETGIAEGSTVQISRNATGEITATINGKDFAFTAADREQSSDGNTYQYKMQDAQGRETNLWTLSGGGLDALLDANGSGYLRVLGGQTNAVNGSASEPNLRYMTLVGAMTPTDALPMLASANYVGRVELDAVPETGFVDTQTSLERLRGNLDMTADFAAGTVSGMASNLEGQAPGDTAYFGVEGSLVLNQAAISGNTFGGQINADSVFQADSGGSLSGSYQGGFFGPNAEEVGAVMTASGTDAAGETYHANGFAVGQKQ